MTYFALHRLAFAIVLSLGLAPSPIQAQQLQQPASVLPWAGSQPEIKLALRPPASAIPDGSPSWLVESAKKSFTVAPKSTGLPMVETEKFVDLGPLEAEPTQPLAGRSPRARSNSSAAVGPLNIFRAPGIQAKRPRVRN